MTINNQLNPVERWSRHADSTGTRMSATVDDEGYRTVSNFGDGRPFPLLDAIKAHYEKAEEVTKATWVLRSYKDYKNGHLLPFLLKDRTLGWANKNLSIVSFAVDGVKIPWSSTTIGQFEFDPNEKLPKRLSMLSWQSDLFIDGMEIKVLEEDEPTPAFDPNVLTVRFYEDDSASADGMSYLSRQRWRHIVDGVPDLKKRRKFRNKRSLNWRGIFPMGNPKGGLLVAAKGTKSKADLLIPWCNVKPEVRSTDGLAYAVMYPESDNDFGEIWIDRQSRSHLWNHLYTEEMVFEWMDQWYEGLKRTVGRGEIPRFLLTFDESQGEEEGDETIIPYTKRLMMWADAGLSVFDSIAITGAVAKGIDLTLNPPSRKADARKFPAQYAIRRMLRSEKDLIMCGDMPVTAPRMGSHESRIHEIGLVIPEVDYPRVAKIMGGGDKDDKVNIPIRKSSEPFASSWMKDEFGKPVIGKHLIILPFRNPLTHAHNKEGEVGIEYWMAEAGPEIYEMVIEHYGSLAGVPEFDVFNRPWMIDELDYDTSKVFKPKGVVLNEYTPEEVAKRAAILPRASIAYGTQSNIQIATILGRVLQEFWGFGEVFIDSCQQTPNEADVQRVEEINFEQGLTWLKEMEATQKPIDILDYNRVSTFFAGIQKKMNHRFRLNVVEDGVSSRMAAKHDEIMTDLRLTVMTEWMPIAAAVFENRFGGRNLTKMKTRKEGSSKPELLYIYDELIKEHKPVTGADYDLVGRRVIDYFKVTEHMDLDISPRALFEHIWDTLSWKAAHLQEAPRDIGNMYRNDDRDLIGGGLIEYYAAFMAAVVAKESEEQE